MTSLNHGFLIITALATAGISWWIAGHQSQPAPQTTTRTTEENNPQSLYTDINTSSRTVPSRNQSLPPASLPDNAPLAGELKEIASAKSLSPDQITHLKSVLKSQSSDDLATICSWARGLDRDSPTTFLILHEALETWASADPENALTEFIQLARGDEEWLQLGIPIAIKPQMNTNPGNTWHELKRKGVLADAPEIEHQLLRHWAQSDLQTAANTIRDIAHTRELPQNGQVAAVVANQLWNTNPDSTIQWIQSLPPDAPASSQAISAVMDRWLNQSPQEAIKWLADTPTSPMRDAGVIALVGSLQNSDPELALRWSSELTPGPMRTRYLIQSMQSLDSIDPALTNSILKDRSLMTDEEAKAITEALWPEPESTSEVAKPER